MATIICEELGIHDFDERNMKCCCPYHDEDTPSFIWNPKLLNFHCFGACGRSYDIIDVYMSRGMTYIEACKKLFELADIPYAFGEHKLKTRRSYHYPKEVVCTDKSQVYKYLQTRAISPATVDYLDIRQDDKGNCVFNYYDENDTLTMVKYRPSHKVKKGENKNWCQPGADTLAILFNMNRINPAQPLLICSGELDCAAAIEAGWLNAVSIPLGDGNLDFCKNCFDWLEQFSSIIICPDNDESGRKFCKSLTPMLGSWRCKIVNFPPTAKDGQPVYIKDLNELLYRAGKDAVLEAILAAEETPVPSVIDLSDVEPTEYEDVDGITFGLKGIDDELMRLFLGTLTLVSGQPGSGKSSILAQLLCNAMDNGFNTWLFSGELPNGVEKSWLNYILAGPRNLERSTSKRGNEYMRIVPAIRPLINQRYRGLWHIYRDDYDNTLEELMNSMTDAVRKYGARCIILDNFMCIDGESDDNELRSQTETIKRLIRFAKKYHVAVVLVCHPRKMDDNSAVGIYDIAGSSNIINLAHRSIALRRIKPEDRENSARFSERRQALLKYDVIVTIIKDRMFGRSNIDIGLYYDPVSRRFFTDEEEYNRQYSWDRNVYQKPLRCERLHHDDEVFGTIEEGKAAQ